MSLFKTKIRYDYTAPYSERLMAKEGEIHTVYLVSEEKGFLLYLKDDWRYVPFHYCKPFEATDQFDHDLKELLKDG